MASSASFRESSNELRAEVWLLGLTRGGQGSKGIRGGQARVLWPEACLAGKAWRQHVAQGLIPWNPALPFLLPHI